jgi:hypothetical protein
MSAIGPGSIVVCVNASDIRHNAPLNKGARYVVREIVPGHHMRTGERGTSVKLRGIYNGATDSGYAIERFRPIDERDAEIFERMIAVEKQKVRA